MTPLLRNGALCILFFTLLLPRVVAQTKYDEILLNGPLNKSYQIDRDSLSKIVFKKFPQKTQTENARQTKIVSDISATQVARELAGHEIYNNWSSAESYVTQILKKLSADDSTLAHIRVVLARDGDFNASMDISGLMTLNVGTFMYVENEAQLAAILAHELAHYKQSHLLKYHINAIENFGYDKYGFLGSKYSERMEFRQSQEMEADVVGYDLLTNAGYSPAAMFKMTETLDFLETRIIKQFRKGDKLFTTTHPLAGQRMNKIQEMQDALAGKQIQGKYYVVDSIQFLRTKYYGEIEAIKCDIQNLNLNNAVEKSFKLHLKKPMNEVYYYYLLESIRKLCYTHDDIWKEKFITYLYFNEADLSIGMLDAKTPISTSIGEKYEPEIIGISPDDLEKLEGKFYWERDQPYFKTYAEAFEFFYRMSQTVNCNECILTNALSLTDKAQKDAQLELYVSKPNIGNREYAQGLLSGKPFSSFSKEKTVVLMPMSIDFKFVNSDNDYSVYQFPGQSSGIDTMFRASAEKLEHKKALILNDLLYSDFSSYVKLSQIAHTAFVTNLNSSNGLDILELYPEYYHFFKKHNCVNFEFMVVSFSQIMRGSDAKSLESYEATREKYETEIFQEDQPQLMAVALTDIYNGRILPNQGSKFFYWKNISLSPDKETDISNYLFQSMKNLEKAKPGIPLIIE